MVAIVFIELKYGKSLNIRYKKLYIYISINLINNIYEYMLMYVKL